MPTKDYVPGKSRGVLVTAIEDGLKTNLSEQISATITLGKASRTEFERAPEDLCRLADGRRLAARRPLRLQSCRDGARDREGAQVGDVATPRAARARTSDSSISSPYRPTGKGKLQHRTLREQFLAELDATHIRDPSAPNARVWV